MLKKSMVVYADGIQKTSNNHLISVGDRLIQYFREDAKKTIQANNEKSFMGKKTGLSKARR
ncbi:MAG: hypothetical protein WC539_05075 [Nitrospirota bacterium]